jgi:hypothetical protein
VTSALPIFVSHRSSAFLRVTLLIAFDTQLTAVLHVGSLVYFRNFPSLSLCFNNRSKTGISLFISESVILFVDSLYAEAIEAVKSRAASSVFVPDLISLLDDISSEVGAGIA